MKKGIGKLFKSPALLVIAVVVMMAAATLAYAHWSGTAPIQGDVNTGNIGVGFWWASTNDDGVDNDWDGGDDGGPYDGMFDNYPVFMCEDETGAWTECGPDSSADPAEPGADPERYAKDVARCSAEPWGDELYFRVENGYPSYHCTIAGYMFGTGSVPVMTDGLMAGASDQFFREECTWYAPDGSEYHGPVSEAYDDEGNFLYAWADFYGEDDQGNSGGTEEEPWSDGVYQNPPEYEVTLGCERFPLNVKDEGGYWGVYDEEWKLVMTFGAGDNTCGMQVDPFWEWDQGEPDPKPYQVWVHVENDALQNANYHLAMEAKFINWNEFAEFNSCAD